MEETQNRIKRLERFTSNRIDIPFTCKKFIKDELDEIKKSLMNIELTTCNGKYIKHYYGLDTAIIIINETKEVNGEDRVRVVFTIRNEIKKHWVRVRLLDLNNLEQRKDLYTSIDYYRGLNK